MFSAIKQKLQELINEVKSLELIYGGPAVASGTKVEAATVASVAGDTTDPGPSAVTSDLSTSETTEPVAIVATDPVTEPSTVTIASPTVDVQS